MSTEKAPDGEFSYVNLDTRAAKMGGVLLSHMELYVVRGLIESSDAFNHESASVDKAGVDLARTLIPLHTTLDDEAAMQKSLRFGLQLTNQILGEDAHKPCLLAVQTALLRQRTMRLDVTSSYNRYLSHNPHLLGTLKDIVKPFAPKDRVELAENVVSFVLEQAEEHELEGYVGKHTLTFDQEALHEFNIPPDHSM